ncbi:hypothetical protein KFE25_014403 [Diacronema lutheri]|uniref:HotDog ACOT-type domain-containing protein n=1 Tax=Diacronema lutheri TaxID=2081491 RepID=A0A8J5XAW7_DIALT|nr:hypothetical protein KFE25_014403 [Diacronema lutheri]
MVETVGVQHVTSAEALDVGVLLRWVDTAARASAELHAGARCNTVGMGDMAVAHVPRVSDVLELVAEPVLVCSTSLDVYVLVTAEHEGTRRSLVCSAVLTLETASAEDGSRALCPAHMPKTDEQLWLRVLAGARHELGALQQADSRTDVEAAPATCASAPGMLQDVRETPIGLSWLPSPSTAAPFTWLGRARAPAFAPSCAQTALEFVEVLRPPLTEQRDGDNDAGGAFGLSVMCAMHKAAQLCAARYARLDGLRVRCSMVGQWALQRGGSWPSDQLLVLAMVNEVFCAGRELEVGVRVIARCTHTLERAKPCSAGYVCFATADGAMRALAPPTTGAERARRARAERRYQRLRARTRLEAACIEAPRGGSARTAWDESLAAEAAMLTLEAPMESAAASARAWRPVPLAGALAARVACACAPGVAREGTLLVRCRAHVRPGVTTIRAVLDALLHQRVEWDAACVQCAPVRGSSSPPDARADGAIGWDVTRVVRRVPLALVGARAVGRSSSTALVLRAWRVDSSCDAAVLASRSVAHGASPDATAQMPPSAFFLCAAPDGGVDLTQVLEVDVASAQRSARLAAEQHVVQAAVRSAAQAVARLLSDCHCDES